MQVSGVLRWTILLVAIWMVPSGNSFSQINAEIDSLTALLEKHPEEDSTRTALLLDLGSLNIRVSPNSSLQNALSALEIAETLSFPELTARALILTGNSYGMLGLTPRQREYYLQALTFVRENNLKEMEANLLNNLGTIEIQDENTEISRSYLRESMRIRRELNSDKNFEAAYGNMGNTFNIEKRYDSALYYFNKAVTIAREKKRPIYISILLANIAKTHSDLKQYDIALEEYRECVSLKRELNDLFGLAETFYNIGNTYRQLGQTDSAVFYLQQSISLADSLGAMNVEADSRRDLAYLFQQNKDFESAYFHANEAIQLLDTLWDQEASGIAEEIELRLSAEQEISNREMESKIKDKEYNRQRIVYFGALLLAGLVLLLLILVWRSSRSRRRANQMLESRVLQRTAEVSRVNSDLRAAIAERERSQKDLNTFIYRASHDLKGPLLSIKGLVEISMDQSEDEKVKSFLVMIDERTTHLYGQLDQLMEQVSLLDREPELERFTFGELWASVLASIQDYPGREKMTFQVDESAPFTIHHDQEFLTVILRNLVRNSIDFRNKNMDAHICTVTCSVIHGRIQFEVADNGIGMVPKVVEKAFEMFFRGDNQSRGSGLGLYAVDRFVHKLNGKVRIATGHHPGAKVIVEIPVLTQKRPPSALL